MKVRFCLIYTVYFSDNLPALLPDFSTELQIDSTKVESMHNSYASLNRFNIQTQVCLFFLSLIIINFKTLVLLKSLDNWRFRVTKFDII